jgi:hypothetical protein
MAFAKAIGNASTNVAAECVGAPRSRYDLHASDRTSIPPGPIWIADDTHAGRRGFTRAVIPAAATNHVGAGLMSQRKMDDGIERPGVLPGLGPRCVQRLLGSGVYGQVLPHEFSIHANVFREIVATADNKIPSIINELAQVSLRKRDAAANIKKIFAVPFLGLG